MIQHLRKRIPPEFTHWIALLVIGNPSFIVSFFSIRFLPDRNFVYYMDKRSYQVKYDGLARTLIERIAPVLVKTRLALLQTNDRRKIKIEQIFAGASLSDFQPVNTRKSDAKISSNADEPEDQLVDLDNPVEDEELIRHQNLGELTIDKWLLHVLKSCPTMKTICSSTEELLKNNWLELHEQLGLPSLLPMYFFIVNVVLDVMNECLRLYNKPYMNNDNIEIDSLCRQQVGDEGRGIFDWIGNFFLACSRSKTRAQVW